MEITAVTTWQGTPAAIKFLVEAAKGAAEIHESLGASNPRFMRPVSGDQGIAHYSVDFESVESYGAFTDAVRKHEWWSQTEQAVADAYPDLEMKGTMIYYNTLD
jgi:hypothetical protein